MAGSNAAAGDGFVRRLETELREKETLVNGIVERANSAERDLTEDEVKMVSETRGRMEQIKNQLDQVEDTYRVAFEYRNRAQQVDQAVHTMRGHQVRPVEYRSAGQWVLDSYRSAMGNTEARDRIEMYYRAADHVKTGDELGVVPDPIIGDVINFIDAARPIVNVLGARPIPSATWHRPYVSQHTSVGKQGTTGAAAQEKSELSSQKLTIVRKDATAVTYGGYVNVSRQTIDFSQVGILDIIIQDLAAQYAVETEAATATALTGVDTTHVGYDATDANSVAAAVWSAVADVYAAVKGQGRLVLAVAPDVLSTVAPLFAPYGPMNQQGTGFNASNFGQGVMGSIAGVQTVMSAGLGAGTAVLFSTAAIEFYEQRVGALQVIEPSVLGLQVAYAGYASPLVILDDGIVPLEASTT